LIALVVNVCFACGHAGRVFNAGSIGAGWAIHADPKFPGADAKCARAFWRAEVRQGLVEEEWN